MSGDGNGLHGRAWDTTKLLLLALLTAWLGASAAGCAHSDGASSRPTGSASEKSGPDLEALIANASILELQAAMQAGRVQQQMQEAQMYGATSEQDLIPIANSLTATELAAVKALREGRLHDVLNKQQQQQTEQAARAARMNHMLGQGAGGTMPGALTGAPGEEAPINPSHWLGMSEEARKRKFGDVEPRIE